MKNNRWLRPGENDLKSQRPDLAAEWDYEKNGDLQPEDVPVHSCKKVWWQCNNCGRSWKASVDGRTQGRGCPYDAGKLPIPGQTDLATLRPDLAAQWNYEKNGTLRPEQVTVHSSKKVWWSCPNCGKSWRAMIINRSRGAGCPYDAGKLPILGATDLATRQPKLAQQWDYEKNEGLTPEHFTEFSHKKVWWKCPNCGRSWKASICNRVYGSGCPYDTGRLPIPGETDLATKRPDLAAQWDYEKNGKLTPEHVTEFSNKNVWWKCPNCGRSWGALISNRSSGRGCPYDAGKLPIPGETDLATKHHDLATQWDYEKNGDLRPEQMAEHSNRKVWWKCPNCGKSWIASVNHRVSGTGCPYDAGRLPIPGETDLLTKRPDLADQWDYEQNGDLRPENVTAHSGKKVWWKCPRCGTAWRAKVILRANGKHKCPQCSINNHRYQRKQV